MHACVCSFGWDPILAMGGVESMTAAAVAALLGGIWAKSLPQTQRNLVIEQQVVSWGAFSEVLGGLRVNASTAACMMKKQDR